MLETLNCVNCSRRNPKRSAKCVYPIGTLASSIAHVNYIMDHLSLPEHVIKNERLHDDRDAKKPGDKEYLALQLMKKCKIEKFSKSP